MTRTVQVTLNPTSEQAPALAETSRCFTEAFNHVCACGWTNDEKNGVTLHHLTYFPLREQLPRLNSDLVCSARVKATETLKSVFARAKAKCKAGQPHSSACPPRYNVKTFKVSWEDSFVRLSTTSGRMTIPFVVPQYATKYIGGRVLSADLIERNGHWRLHIAVELPTPTFAHTPEVVGVDLGIARPAVTSTNRFLGSRHWKRVEARTLNLRRTLQAKATKSARRHLTRVRHHQANFRRDCDHVLSKQIVAAVEPGGTVVLEDLSHIRSRIRLHHGAQSRRLHGWSFAQLQSFVAYKAEEKGLTVALVNPTHTSQACSSCRHTARNNRRSQSAFECRKCGFSLNADLNAARNIAAKYLTSTGIPSASGLSVNQPIAGKTLSPASRRL
mgnify:FL=1